MTQRDSLPKNENDVINYLPPCRSNPVRPLFIFRKQITIYLMKSRITFLMKQQSY